MDNKITLEKREYRVHVTVQYPNWNMKQGTDFIVSAESKKDAVAKVRHHCWKYGNVDGQGLIWLKATEVEDGEDTSNISNYERI